MSSLPRKDLVWPIIWEGVELIAISEGCRLSAYQCSAGVWTIGWGETLGVKQGMTWTQEQADEAFCRRLAEFTSNVSRLLQVKAIPQQLAAFVSLAYNIGVNAFAQSSALRLHNQGKCGESAAAIKLWNKAGGKVLAGLVTRRAKEAALYLSALITPDTPQELEPLPDADPTCDKPLEKSASMQAGAATVGAATLAGIAQVVQQVTTVPHSVGLVLKWSVPVLIVVALVAGCIVCYRAWKRRQDSST